MERENRKVLISVKVSTLLLILISIIAIIVLTNIIKDKLQIHAELASNTSSEEILNEEEIQQTKRVIKAEISSRGTNEEEQRTSHEENLEDVTNEETEDEKLTKEPVILYGSVGGINFDTSVENSIEEEIVVEEPETTKIEDVTISKDMDLTIRTGLSREDFITLISGVKEDKSGFFEENSGLIFDICEEYNINEKFFF